MKVYVDELPKSCRECFCNVEDTWCALSDGEMGDICEECDNKTRHKKCPLQSLSDYTKQVRKEVIKEYKNKMLYCSERFMDNSHYYNGKELDEILEQIQGE